MQKLLLLAGPVALVVGRMLPESRPKLRLAALALGGTATVWGAWNLYKNEGQKWAS